MVVERTIVHDLLPEHRLQHLGLKTLVVNIASDLPETLRCALVRLEIVVVEMEQIPTELLVQILRDGGLSGTRTALDRDQQRIIFGTYQLFYCEDHRHETRAIPLLLLI